MQTGRKKRWWLTPVILSGGIILLHLLALRTDWIEKIYSVRIYPVVASALRICTKWIPFSLGDALYASVIIWAVYKIIQFFRRKLSWKKFFVAFRGLTVKFLWVYFFFLVLWGLNYYRYGIGYQLHLQPDNYSTEDLTKLTAQLIYKVNENRRQLDSLHYMYPECKTVFQAAIAEYDTAKNTFPYLKYAHADVKKMLSGIFGNYGGFLGYYNPFTGEAQVNTKVPEFIIPFTNCHEIAHQLGYASESEASFVGYLVVKANNSPMFKYSTYFELFGYANSELYSRDSVTARQNIKMLDTLVKKDILIYKQYLTDYENPIEPLLTKLYGSYLKVHNQPKGIESYNEVVAWIVSYYKRYGEL